MKIRKGDNVYIISGKDRGRSGKVLRAFPRLQKVIVAGVNKMKKHERARKQGTKGQVVKREMPIHVSNLMLVDPKTQKPTRVRMEIVSGKKVRVSKRSGSVI